MKAKIPVNNHIHTLWSDGKNTEDEMADAALENGLEIITFTDHFFSPEIVKFNPHFTAVLTKETVEKYINKIKAMEKEGLKILSGLEADYSPEAEHEVWEAVEKTNPDFVLICAHNLEQYSIDEKPELFEKAIKAYKGINGLIEEYYVYMAKAIESGIGDCIAHLDIIKKFNKDEKYFKEDNELYVGCINHCLDLMEENEIALEINTAGLDKAVAVQYPSEWILRKCLNRVDITIGTDAHETSQMTRHYDEAEKMIKEIGFDKIVYFEKGQKKYFELE